MTAQNKPVIKGLDIFNISSLNKQYQSRISSYLQRLPVVSRKSQ